MASCCNAPKASDGTLNGAFFHYFSTKIVSFSSKVFFVEKSEEPASARVG